MRHAGPAADDLEVTDADSFSCTLPDGAAVDSPPAIVISRSMIALLIGSSITSPLPGPDRMSLKFTHHPRNSAQYHTVTLKKSGLQFTSDSGPIRSPVNAPSANGSQTSRQSNSRQILQLVDAI
jgi:hypothetical protein